MDCEDNDKIKVIEAELNKTKEEYKILLDELNETKEHLKKYTAPKRSKTYYENHKEELLEKMKKYIPSPEKLKEKNRKAYLKRKERKANILDESI